MTSDFVRGTAAGIAACLVAGGLAIAVGAANAQSTPQAVSAATSGVVRTCAAKKTGALRLLAKGKCKKSERLVTWNQAGPVGPAGPAGPAGAQGPAGAGMPVVRDGNGNVVPGVVSASSLTRLVDGGLFGYESNGRLRSSSIENQNFVDSGCTTPVSWQSSDEEWVAAPQARKVLRYADGHRAAFVETGPVIGPVSLYSWFAYPSRCDLLTSSTYLYRALQEIPLPPDLPGPLTVSLS